MKKNYLKWFTLIELLVVISIMIILSVSWIFYFSKQIDSLDLQSKVDKIVDNIDKLDNQVKTKKILDYSLKIKKNSLWYIVSTNNLWLDYRQNINMDFDTWTGILSTNYSNTWASYSLKIYSWIKFQWNYIIDAKEQYTYNFLGNKKSKITATLSWMVLNNIYINYYSDDNILKNNENKLILDKINSKSDKTWTNYDYIELKNKFWKKELIWYIWWTSYPLTKVYLFFNKSWLEKFIEIKK